MKINNTLRIITLALILCSFGTPVPNEPLQATFSSISQATQHQLYMSGTDQPQSWWRHHWWRHPWRWHPWRHWRW